MAKKPSRDQRDAWVTLLAEPDKNRDQLSPLALRVVDYVRRNLDDEGYDFELNLDDTGGVAYAEVHFRTLTKADGKKRIRTLNGTENAEPRTDQNVICVLFPEYVTSFVVPSGNNCTLNRRSATTFVAPCGAPGSRMS